MAGMQRRVFGIALVLANLASHAVGQCYFPGGDWAPNSFPCMPYAYTSACCPLGFTCLTNLLCVVTDQSIVGNDVPVGTAFRPSCENPLGNASACGNFCQNDPADDNSGSLTPCGGEVFCCSPAVAQGTCNCGTGEGTFTLDKGFPITILGVTAAISTIIVPSYTQAVTEVSSTLLASTASMVSSSTATTSDGITSLSSLISGLSPTSTSKEVPNGPVSSIIIFSPTTVVVLVTPSTTGSVAITSSFIESSTAISTTLITSTSSSADGTPPTSTAEPGPPLASNQSLKVTDTIAFKAGIGAAVAFVVLALLAIAFWYLKKENRLPSWGHHSEWVHHSDSVASHAMVPIIPSDYQEPEPNPHPYYRSSSDSRRDLQPDVDPRGLSQPAMFAPPIPPAATDRLASRQPYNAGPPSFRVRQESPLRNVERQPPPRGNWRIEERN